VLLVAFGARTVTIGARGRESIDEGESGMASATPIRLAAAFSRRIEILFGDHVSSAKSSFSFSHDAFLYTYSSSVMLGRHTGSRLKLNGADYDQSMLAHHKILGPEDEGDKVRFPLTISRAGFSSFLWRLRRMVWTRVYNILTLDLICML
jgi:hypothetical protein